MRRASIIALLLASCAFNPDLSRFPPCRENDSCAAGSSCLTEEQRCVPSCGEHCEDAGPSDAGHSADAGADAGIDAGVDAGPELALAPATLPAAIETRAYAFTFRPTGGERDGGYFFAITGAVPGFTLSTGGILSTAAAPDAGTFPFSVTVRDAANTQVTQNFSLEVRPLLRVASGVLVEGRQNQAYSQQLSATGGTPPYSWVVDGGSPPSGTSLSSDGLLTGSPSASTMVSFGVSVSDSAVPGQSASRNVSVDTQLLVPTLAIATRAAADGRVGTAYSQPLKSYGGSAPFTWSIMTGSASLPPGLSLTNAGANWQLVGIPTMTGTFPFTVKVADSLLASQQQAMSITIY